MKPTIFLAATLLMTSCAHMNPRFVDGPQGKLRVDDGGSGASVPVLFVHGNGANRTQWRYQLEHLRPRRRAVAFDLRAMGESDVPRNGDYSVEGVAGDVAAVADALHLSRFVIVGHSYGGAVVAAYTAEHPERVAGMLLADAAGTVKISDEAASVFLKALREDKDKVVRQWFAPILVNASDAVKEEVFASVSKTPANAFASALDGLRSFDAVRAVESYHGPLLAIAVTSTESPSSLHKQVPSIPIVKMDGVSHWMMLDKPQEFNRILDELLRTVDASEARH